MASRSPSRFTYANVVSTLALFLALSGGAAYASHLTVYSSDIVNGQVKRFDIARNAVNGARVEDSSLTGADIKNGTLTGSDLKDGSVGTVKIRDGSLTGADVLDGSLLGADIGLDALTGLNIDELSLVGVNADRVDGFHAGGIARLGGASKRVAEDMPDCTPGLDYLVYTFTVPSSGFVLVNATFTASNGNFTPSAFAARIERTAPSVIVGEWMEDHFDSPNGRYSIPLTQVFPVSQGSNTFSLKVCDTQDAAEIVGTARAAQMTVLFVPFGL